jgi:hypothetical protein
MLSSIDGFPFERIPDQQIANALELPLGAARARRVELARQLRDPAWVARALDELPAATLGVLAIMVEAGGLVFEPELFAVARERYGMSTRDVELAVGPALHRVLAVPIRTTHGEAGVSVVDLAGDALADQLRGLDRVDSAVTAFVASDPGIKNPRTFLAVCMATRHADLRLTNDGRPHRGAVKRLAKQLALDDELVGDMVMLGWGAGLLRPDDEVLRPDLPVVLDAAAGRYPRSPGIRAALERLAGGPMEAKAVLRWSSRRETRFDLGIGPDVFALLPGFAVGLAGSAPVIGLAAGEGVVAGHVTPSFEVMLPPEARLQDLVHVGGCCEWERIDRAIVGRITKAAVARAVAAGTTADELVVQLGAASRHPVPQNVEAAVRDWAGSTLRATVSSGHVVVVPVAARERAAAALAKWPAHEPAPGVFVVDLDEPIREIRAALAKAGVVTADAGVRTPDDPLEALDEAARAREVPVEPEPGPAARRNGARVAAWRRGEAFEGRRDDYLERARREVDGEDAARADAEAEAELARWARRHGIPVERHAMVYPAVIAQLGRMAPAARDALFASAPTLVALMRGLDREAAPPRTAAPSRSRRAEPRRPPPLLWQTTDVRAALEAAAQAHRPLAINTRHGDRFLRIERVLRRGQRWMVLGEDLATGGPVAVPLDWVTAVAALPDDLAAHGLDGGGAADPSDAEGEGDAEGPGELPFGPSEPARPWRPAPGQSPPAGHLPCPCGSGERYRNCCRNVASA